MTKEKHTKPAVATGIEQICFGLDRRTDETSLQLFLLTFSNDDLLKTLIPRLENKEIDHMVNYLTGVMKKHLKKEEYHRLFMNWPHT